MTWTQWLSVLLCDDNCVCVFRWWGITMPTWILWESAVWILMMLRSIPASRMLVRTPELKSKLLPVCGVNVAFPTHPLFFSPSSFCQIFLFSFLWSFLHPRCCPTLYLFNFFPFQLFLFLYFLNLSLRCASRPPSSHICIFCYSSLLSFLPLPPVLGGLCTVVTPCRSEGTTWPSWTLSASWTPIWTHVSPLTLSPPLTSWVRR